MDAAWPYVAAPLLEPGRLPVDGDSAPEPDTPSAPGGSARVGDGDVDSGRSSGERTAA
jgi:hypothetical protein